MSARRHAIETAWNATFNVNKLDRESWEQTLYLQVNKQIKLFL